MNELSTLFVLRLEVIHSTLTNYIDTMDEKDLPYEAINELENARGHINAAILYIEEGEV